MTQMNSIPPVQPSGAPGQSQQDLAMAAIAQLAPRVKSGASNFYWIAALSVINTVISVFGGGMYFVVGLAASLLVDGIFLAISEMFPGAQWIVMGLGVLVSLGIAGMFALFGYFGSKGKRWAFIVGMVFYVIDALLMLAFQEWMGLIFHLFFLWGLFGGLQALNQLQKFLPQETRTSDFPQNIGVS